MHSTVDGTVTVRSSRATGWVGWVIFGAVTLMVSGAASLIWGIVGIAKDQIFLVGRNGNVLSLDYTAWGWIHIGIGVLAIVAGVALFSGALWAGIIAILLCTLSIVANLLSLAAYPVWSVIVIALDILVIYAITVHGEELSPDY
jgi:hypothetical protein